MQKRWLLTPVILGSLAAGVYVWLALKDPYPAHMGPDSGPDFHLGGSFYLTRNSDAISLRRWSEPPCGDAVLKVPANIVAVGYDKTYIVIKQHPASDIKTTNYYIISRDSWASAEYPPMNSTAFASEKARLSLPDFRTTLPALTTGKDITCDL